MALTPFSVAHMNPRALCGATRAGRHGKEPLYSVGKDFLFPWLTSDYLSQKSQDRSAHPVSSWTF